jgi:hypothetical protein
VSRRVSKTVARSLLSSPEYSKDYLARDPGSKDETESELISELNRYIDLSSLCFKRKELQVVQ